jgi:RecA/RadA recombinase
LLRREPPRLASGRLGEDIAALVSATLGLDRSVLPVQGPPGTGKTFRGARMIVAALAAGRRVGITAPSHAAIHNLLHDVERYAHEMGQDRPGDRGARLRVRPASGGPAASGRHDPCRSMSAMSSTRRRSIRERRSCPGVEDVAEQVARRILS